MDNFTVDSTGAVPLIKEWVVGLIDMLEGRNEEPDTVLVLKYILNHSDANNHAIFTIDELCTETGVSESFAWYTITKLKAVTEAMFADMAKTGELSNVTKTTSTVH